MTTGAVQRTIYFLLLHFDKCEVLCCVLRLCVYHKSHLCVCRPCLKNMTGSESVTVVCGGSVGLSQRLPALLAPFPIPFWALSHMHTSLTSMPTRISPLSPALSQAPGCAQLSWVHTLSFHTLCDLGAMTTRAACDCYILTAPCSWIEACSKWPKPFSLAARPADHHAWLSGGVSYGVCVYSALGRCVWGALIATEGHRGRVASRAGTAGLRVLPIVCCSASLPLVSPLLLLDHPTPSHPTHYPSLDLFPARCTGAS